MRPIIQNRIHATGVVSVGRCVFMFFQGQARAVMAFGMAFVAFVTSVNCALGAYPVPISSKTDIRNAGPETQGIVIVNLPIQDYPFLSKFVNLKGLRYAFQNDSDATDIKLDALSRLPLTNLIDVGLLNCRLVTDEGLRSLSRIKSLRMLQLEGTALTDAGCDVIVSKMELEGLNVANCSGVTIKGIKSLASATKLRTLRFSADDISQEQCLDLVASFKSIVHCEIVDLVGKLDASSLTAKGKEKGIKVSVRRDGSLQNIDLDRKRKK